jgi:hypothetical protein
MTSIKWTESANLSQLFIMFILGGMTGLIYMMLTPVWWLMFLAVAIMIAIFINDKVAILIILATLFVFHWLFGVFRAIPKEITWLPDVIILIMAAKILYLQAKKNRWERTPIDLIMLSILLLGIISAVYNNVAGVTLLFGFRKFFKYTLMFFILRNIEQETKFYRFFMILLFILALLQIPVTIVQAIHFGTTGKDVADNVSGTLGGKATGAMALFMSFIISMMMGFYTQTKKVVFLLVSAGFLIPIILGSGQFGLLIAPLAALICWILGRPLNLKNIVKIPLIISIIIMLVLPGINYHDARYKGNLMKFLRSPTELYSLNIQKRKEGTFGRFQVIDVAHQLLLDNIPQLIVGFGPGNASQSYFSEYSGKLDKEYQGFKIWGIQYTATILEYGFLGLILFLLLFLQLWRVNRQFYHRTKNQFWKAISVGYNGLLFVYTVGSFYNPVWYYDILSFTFWFITAGLVVQMYAEKTTELNL